MAKRITAVALWFVSTWMAYGLVAYVVGLPDGGGVVIGLLTATFVGLDPTNQLWGTTRARSPGR